MSGTGTIPRFKSTSEKIRTTNSVWIRGCKPSPKSLRRTVPSSTERLGQPYRAIMPTPRHDTLTLTASQRRLRSTSGWSCRLLLIAAMLIGSTRTYAGGDLSDVSDLGGPEPAFSNGSRFAGITQAGTANTARVDQTGQNGISILQQGTANAAQAAQAGLLNWTSLVQSGMANQFTLSQSGAGNSVTTSQAGGN